jgi:hypothetical protein
MLQLKIYTNPAQASDLPPHAYVKFSFFNKMRWLRCAKDLLRVHPYDSLQASMVHGMAD